MVACLWFVCGSSLIWALAYLALCNVNHMHTSEWNCRIIAMIHSLLVTKLVEVMALITGPWPFTTLAHPNTSLQNITLIISAGYFIFDIIWCTVMQTEGYTMMAHHVISGVSLVGVLLHGKSASEVVAVVWGSELTNPFLQIRWFLREAKAYDTNLSKVNDVIFIILFAFVRVGIGAYVYILVLQSATTIWWVKIGGTAFYLIGVVWMWQILCFARKRFFSTKKH